MITALDAEGFAQPVVNGNEVETWTKGIAFNLEYSAIDEIIKLIEGIPEKYVLITNQNFGYDESFFIHSRRIFENKERDGGKPVRLDDSMQDILPIVASQSWPVPVVDYSNKFKGVVSKNRFLKTLHRAEESREELAAVSVG